jgi:hypothetical protein
MIVTIEGRVHSELGALSALEVETRHDDAASRVNPAGINPIMVAMETQSTRIPEPTPGATRSKNGVFLGRPRVSLLTLTGCERSANQEKSETASCRKGVKHSQSLPSPLSIKHPSVVNPKVVAVGRNVCRTASHHCPDGARLR